jgi:hypothetical protein
MQYCSQSDPQAQRLLYILTSFRDVVSRRQETPRAQFLPHTTEDPIKAIFSSIADNQSSIHRVDQPILVPTNTEASKAALQHGRAGPGVGFTPNQSLRSPNLENSHMGPIVDLNDMLSTPGRESQDNLVGIRDLGNIVPQNGAPSHDSNESLGDVEIDFDAFWDWPPTGTGGIMSRPVPMGSIGEQDIRGISDSAVPLYGITALPGH